MGRLILFLAALAVAAGACSPKTRSDLLLIKGGALPDFYLGRYEVTQKEWKEVMESNPSKFKGDRLPVETVSWYDCIDYCNRRSIKEGLKSCYTIEKDKKDPGNTNDLDDMKWTVTIDPEANGYRLPAEAEWEYAARGGQMSKGYLYSGSNKIDDVAWYWKNAGDKSLSGDWSWPALVQNNNRTHPVGQRRPNELGLYDMSGNVREWCWDLNAGHGTADPQGRIWKGGGWMGADFCCEPAFRAAPEANAKGPDQGFRICRNALP